MTRMNSRSRRRFYKIVSERDGEVCKNCRVPVTEKQLVIDHINNKNSDNQLQNLQLLCRKCNYLKNRIRKGPVDIVCMNVCEERPLPPEMLVNRRKEPKFRQWLFAKVKENGRIRFEEAINAGAEHIDVSTETVKRYLRKMISSEGSYTVINDAQGYPYVCFKQD